LEQSCSFFIAYGRDAQATRSVGMRLREFGIDVYFEKKDFYTAESPENAEFTTSQGDSWCLVGV